MYIFPLRTLCLVFLGSPLLVFGVTVSVSTTTAGCGSASGTATATVSGGIPPYAYVWSPTPPFGQGTPQITGLMQGVYTVEVTDGLGNTAQASGMVEQYSALNYPYFWTVRNDCMNSCSGGITIDENTLGGAGTYFYTNPAPQYSGSYATLMGICASGPGSMITISDINGCSVTITADISNSDGGQPDVNYILPECGSNSNGQVALWDNYFGPAWYRVYNASFDSIYEFSDGPYVITGLPAGTFTIYLYDPAGEFGADHVYCTFDTEVVVPNITEPCGQVSGTIYNDADQDCTIDANEYRLPYRVLTIGPGPVYTISNINGEFIAALPQGNYTLTQPLVQEAQLCPAQHPVPFALTVADPNAVVDLADSSLAQHDLAVSIHPSTNARPGFPTSVYVLLTNTSAYPSGAVTISLSYDPLLLNPSPANAQWTIPSIPPYGQGTYYFEALVPADITLLGHVLNYSVTVTNTNIETDPTNNNASTAITITGSYDPNDKRGWTSSGSSEDQYFLDEDSYIDYTVRFQNTGTAAAETVVIRDVIDTDLDITSIQILGASHAFTPSFGEGRELVFTFNAIDLPDSTTDLLGSQGFVSYRIKPVSDIVVGDLLENTAGIYFDFNPPIITNTVDHVVDMSTSINLTARDSQRSVAVSPNPTSDKLFLGGLAPGRIAVDIRSADGRLVQTLNTFARDLDVGELEPGTYTLTIWNAEKPLVARFVKL